MKPTMPIRGSTPVQIPLNPVSLMAPMIAEAVDPELFRMLSLVKRVSAGCDATAEATPAINPATVVIPSCSNFVKCMLFSAGIIP